MSSGNDGRFAAIILAAGSSSRMGRPKLILPWGPTTVLGHLLEVWKNLSARQVAVVRSESDSAMDAELDRLKFPKSNRITNPAPERGMFSSIQCAAQWPGWEPGVAHWAIVLGDQPHLRPGTLAGLLEFAGRHPGKICQPSRRGRPRHPVLLPSAVVNELGQSRAETLKGFLEPLAGEVRLIELEDPGLDMDMDTPADYEKALKMYFDAASAA
jgi:molybdenum cofactor cytidylyltransferase